jgi:L-galactose dehydrogenase
LSVLGFGAAPLGGAYENIDPAEAARAVRLAIERGINFFDTAPYYGSTLSETRLGEALEGVRDQVIVCTKCARYGLDFFDFSASRVATSIDESLKRLRTDHVDLLIAHDIEFGDREQVIGETIPAMRRIQQAGKARFIGVSGLPLDVLADAVRHGNLDFVLSYCHYNLMSRDLDQLLRPLTSDRVGLINASPLHMGMLTPEGPPAWHPAPGDVKRAAARVVELCQSRGVDVTTVALRFCLDYPYVASTLVGMSTRSQVERNLEAFDFEIDPDLLAEIEKIIAPVKDKSWPSGIAQKRA